MIVHGGIRLGANLRTFLYAAGAATDQNLMCDLARDRQTGDTAKRAINKNQTTYIKYMKTLRKTMKTNKIKRKTKNKTYKT